MAEKDKVQKVLEDYNDVFADIYNTLLFQRPILEADKLDLGPQESLYKNELGGLNEQRRDVMKTYRNTNLLLYSLGIENQTTIDKNMPIRVMGYDYATYRSQLDNGKSVMPVITIVLNFTDKRWDAPKDLLGLLDESDELTPYVKNYEITVFDITFLDDEVIESFTSDFKLIASYFKKKRLGTADDVLANNTIPMEHAEAVMDFFSVFEDDIRFNETLTEEFKEKVKKGEPIYMCELLDNIEKRGIEQGIMLNMCSLVKEGLLDKEVAAAKLNMTVEEFVAEMEKAK